MAMLLTHEKIYFATSAAKGCAPREMWLMLAKHLETLVGKDVGVPLVILKRTKDEGVNKKTFSDITDAIKSAGVFTWE